MSTTKTNLPACKSSWVAFFVWSVDRVHAGHQIFTQDFSPEQKCINFMNKTHKILKHKNFQRARKTIFSTSHENMDLHEKCHWPMKICPNKREFTYNNFGNAWVLLSVEHTNTYINVKYIHTFKFNKEHPSRQYIQNYLRSNFWNMTSEVISCVITFIIFG